MSMALVSRIAIPIVVATLLSHFSLAYLLKSSSKDPGTVKIGFVVPAHSSNLNRNNENSCCGAVASSDALLVSQFRRIIQDVNNATILPKGLRIGYEILDSCSSQDFATAQVLEWLTQKVHNQSDPLAVVIGGGLSRITQAIAPLMTRFGIPVLDYGSTSPVLSDRRQFSMFARTVPSDGYLAKVIADLIARLGWKCVHLLYSSGDYGENGAEAVGQHLLQTGVCLAGGKALRLSLDESATTSFDNAVQIVKQSEGIRPVVCMCEGTSIRGLLTAFLKQQKQGQQDVKYFMIAGDFWGTELSLENLQNAADGGISFRVASSAGKAWSPGVPYLNADLNSWVRKTLPETAVTDDPWLNECLEKVKYCSINQSSTVPRCDPNSTTFSESDLPPSDHLATLRNTIYAAALGLKSFFEVKCRSPPCADFISNAANDGFELYQHIINASFEFETGGNFSFYNGRDGYPKYDIVRYSRGIKGSSDVYSYTVVGQWDVKTGLSLSMSSSLQQFYSAMPGSEAGCAGSMCLLNCTPGKIVSGDSEHDGDGASNRVCLPGSVEPKSSAVISSEKNLIPAVAFLSAFSAVCIAAIIALLARLFLFRGKTRRAKQTDTQQCLESVLADASCNLDQNVKTELRELIGSATVRWRNLVVTTEILGKGRNGVVYKGYLHFMKRAEPVAVKELVSNSPPEIVNFIRESSIMHTFNHVNVLNLIGISISPANVFRIIVPFMGGGDLRTHLLKNGSKLVDQDRIDLITQICSAMEYLAARNCIHRDLACRNILLQNLPYMTLLKVADFGLARQLNESDYFRPNDQNATPIPIRWWPPESLRTGHLFEERSDVWSFGVCCLEIFNNGARPYGERSNSDVFEFVTNQDGHPERPALCNVNMFERVMKKCWQPLRLDRPRFSELLSTLKNLDQPLSNGNYENADQRPPTMGQNGQTRNTYVIQENQSAFF